MAAFEAGAARVLEAAEVALKRYGSGCTGSRFLNGTLDLHVQLEHALAEFLGKDDCIVFSTGYGANLGLISGMVGRSDKVYLDKLDHASIVDGAKMSYGRTERFAHGDMVSLERKIQSDPDRGSMIIVDGVYSMEGDIADVPSLVQIAQRHGVATSAAKQCAVDVGPVDQRCDAMLGAEWQQPALGVAHRDRIGELHEVEILSGDDRREIVERSPRPVGDAEIPDAAGRLPLAQRRELGVEIDQVVDLHQVDALGPEEAHRIFHLGNSSAPTAGPNLGGEEGAVAPAERGQLVADDALGAAVHGRGIDHRTAGIEQDGKHGAARGAHGCIGADVEHS